jgi:hypothetical protein
VEASRSLIHGGGLLVASLNLGNISPPLTSNETSSQGRETLSRLRPATQWGIEIRLSPDWSACPKVCVNTPQLKAAHQSVQQISSTPVPFRFKPRDPVCLAGRMDQIPPHAHPWFEP